MYVCMCVDDAVNQLGSDGITKLRDLLSSSSHLPQLQSLRLFLCALCVCVRIDVCQSIVSVLMNTFLHYLCMQ